MDFTKLPPFATIPYLNAPVMTTVTPPSGQSAVAAAYDPMRVVLMFGGNQTILLGTSSAVSAALNNSVGLSLTQSNGYLIMTYWEHGPIVCAQWWCAAPGSTVPLTIITQSLSQWPGENAGDPAQALFVSSKPPVVAPPPVVTPGRAGAWNPLAYWKTLMAKINRR